MSSLEMVLRVISAKQFHYQYIQVQKARECPSSHSAGCHPPHPLARCPASLVHPQNTSCHWSAALRLVIWHQNTRWFWTLGPRRSDFTHWTVAWCRWLASQHQDQWASLVTAAEHFSHASPWCQQSGSWNWMVNAKRASKKAKEIEDNGCCSNLYASLTEKHFICTDTT